MELVCQVHEEELEPALYHLLVVAGLTGVKQLPALGGGVLVLVEILGGRVQISLDRVMVVFCFKALLATAITRFPSMPLSSDSPSPCGIAVAPCGSVVAPCCGNLTASGHFLLPF